MMSYLKSARRTLPRHMLVLLTLYLVQDPCRRKIKLSRTNLRKSLKVVRLQATNIKLEYSHERLIESHTVLEVANEVLVTQLNSTHLIAPLALVLKLNMIYLVLTHVAQKANLLGMIV
jgi:hypothetical protein